MKLLGVWGAEPPSEMVGVCVSDLVPTWVGKGVGGWGGAAATGAAGAAGAAEATEAAEAAAEAATEAVEAIEAEAATAASAAAAAEAATAATAEIAEEAKAAEATEAEIHKTRSQGRPETSHEEYDLQCSSRSATAGHANAGTSKAHGAQAFTGRLRPDRSKKKQ